MGMFSRLFGWSEQRSFVRKWTKNRWRKLRYSNELLSTNKLTNLFVSTMWTLCRFWDEDTKKLIPSDMRKIGFDASEFCSGDAVLFEVGCYMFFRLDTWLYKHELYGDYGIITALGLLYKQLFTSALAIKDVSELYSQRYSLYAELTRNGAKTEEYYNHLLWLIIRTSQDQVPKSYNFENEPITITGFTKYASIKFALAAWEETMIPALKKTIEQYCDLEDEELEKEE